MDLQTINRSIEEVSAKMLAALQKRDEEITRQGAATAETAKQVESFGKEVIELKAEQRAKYDEFVEKLADAGVRMDEIDKKFGRQRAAFGDAATAQSAKSIAEQFVTGDAFKAFRESKGKPRESAPIEVKSLFALPGAEQKATFSLTSVTGDLVVPMRSDLVGMQQRQFRIRDLMGVQPMSSNSITYLEETAFATQGGTASVTGITRTSSTATATTAVAHGLVDGDLVRVSGANQAGYNIDAYVTVVDATTFTYTVDSGTVTPATGTILYQKLNGYGAAATVGEGNLKPEALMELIERTATAQVIAQYLKMTRQAANDAPQVQGYIEKRLLYGVAYTEEQQILYGSGSGTNLQGILTHPRVQTYNWSDGETDPVADTKIDAIRRAMTKAHQREFVPSGVVVNPVDWEDVELVKGADGHYIWLQVNTGAGLRMFQMPVVVTNAIVPGDFLVGSFDLGAQLYDREQASIQIATENEDDFLRNKISILAEERVALAITRPDAFVAGNFDAEPS